MIIKALYDNKPCFVNTEYIVDVFQEDFNSYIAYTFDNEREGYVIGKEDFEKWLKFQNDDVQSVRIVKEHTNCPYSDECTSSCRNVVIGNDDYMKAVRKDCGLYE